jgi:hypothetical protein
MNYIAEINNFNDWLLENPLNSSEQALWYKLMAYANQFGWKSEFSIANTRLCDDLKITRQHLDKCRSTLINKGLLSYKKGNGNQCGTYHINSFESVDTVVDTRVAQEWHSSLPLNKLNETINSNLNLNNKGEPDFSVQTIAEFQEQIKDLPIDEQFELKSKYLSMKHTWKKG